MRTLFIDCQMGAAGDMLLAALSELTENQSAYFENVRQMGVPCLDVRFEKTEREGLQGTQAHLVAKEVEDTVRTLTDVCQVIDRLHVSEAVKNAAKGVYQIIAASEAKAHNTDIHHVHFHEVGALSAIADITGVCMAMESLGVEQVIVSPIHVGSGTIKCAHGILPVPAPATARILEGLPIYSGDVLGELCTPTGAALLRYFADEFGPCPEAAPIQSGRGFGTKVFPNKINGIGVTIFA